MAARGEGTWEDAGAAQGQSPGGAATFFAATRVDRQLLGAEACTGSLLVAAFSYLKRCLARSCWGAKLTGEAVQVLRCATGSHGRSAADS